MTPVQILAMIAAVALGAQLTRWLPFLLFPEGKAVPKVVSYLGKVLPAFYVVATVNGIKYLVLFECKEEYLVNLVNFTGKTVIEKDYK